MDRWTIHDPCYDEYYIRDDKDSDKESLVRRIGELEDTLIDIKDTHDLVSSYLMRMTNIIKREL